MAPSPADVELNIRPLLPDDVDFLRGLASDPRVVRFIGDGQPWTELYLQQRLREALAGSQVRWFIACDQTGARVGLLSLRLRAPGRVEVGYWVAPDHWGHGYAGRLLQHGVELCRVEGQAAVVARVRAGNGASQRVLLRGGFVEAERQDDPSLVLYEHNL
ncbi:Protein N-acetyltransferase, RimJ/RimL family [Quadrisphaera granulorum]|uniref:RimJ/RimL family protein N-acetyltransferase n=1 Tax=Quadrisphaera granulorum TaxID=317664 RepID=A0A316AB47_9ACTN|nr:GNAT family N-acetyltransferase [Quadrisphaera granulorum]PWJ54933.1 RimJ/RimL family protein N-acetyltransferase [Quadrisphaera granulorum]SZE95879.1 Protein N-acetyltransferase, RimJ/RimL family [Quadrisphaera granulorum]